MTLVLSLFPGIGMFDLAFELEGFCTSRGPDPIFNSLSDIRAYHPPAGKFDGVIGGPPCQCFSSLAHLVRANGYEPKFGNLIPEFERCVAEAAPAWFLMENVRAAPEPVVAGYSVKSFLLNNAWLLGENGLGLEQERLRRFCFGMRGREAPNLMRWIDVAALLLPERAGTQTQWTPNNSQEVKRRKRSATSNVGGFTNGSPPGGHDRPPSVRDKTVTSSDGGASVRMRRYSFAEACRLQGLPKDFLVDSPFRADAKLKAIANGVPLPMGCAIARAIKEAIS